MKWIYPSEKELAKISSEIKCYVLLHRSNIKAYKIAIVSPPHYVYSLIDRLDRNKNIDQENARNGIVSSKENCRKKYRWEISFL